MNAESLYELRLRVLDLAHVILNSKMMLQETPEAPSAEQVINEANKLIKFIFE
jgi:hypothetical protein